MADNKRTDCIHYDKGWCNIKKNKTVCITKTSFNMRKSRVRCSEIIGRYGSCECYKCDYND